MTFTNYNMMNMYNTGFGSYSSCNGFGNVGFGGIGNIFSGYGLNNIFYNSCNGTYNYNARAGFALGNVLMQIGGNVLNQFIAYKQETSTKNVEADLKGLNKQINASVQKLGCESVEEALSYDIEEDPVGQRVATLNNELNDKKVSLSNYEANYVYKMIMEKYENAEKQDPQPNDIDQLKADADAAKKALSDKENLEKEIKKLEETTIPAAEKAKNARETEIDKVQSSLRELVSQRDELQGVQNEQTLKKADGNKFNRVSTTELNDKFTQAEDGSYSTKAEASFTKRDFFTAVKEYQTASSDKKKEWKNKIKLIYDNMSGDEKSAKIVEAFDLIYPENKKS